MALSDADVLAKVILFSWFIAASYLHFDRGTGEPFGMKLIRIVSPIGFAVNFWYWGQLDKASALAEPGIATALVLLSGTIFAAATTASKRKLLGVAFGKSRSHELLRNGVYGYIRHPFYASYMLYWISWVPTTNWSIFSVSIALLLTILYLRAAQIEEEDLKNAFPRQHDSYAAETGRFLPRLRRVKKAAASSDQVISSVPASRQESGPR